MIAYAYGGSHAAIHALIYKINTTSTGILSPI